jgi:hypothetical protein
MQEEALAREEEAHSAWNANVCEARNAKKALAVAEYPAAQIVTLFATAETSQTS